MVKVHMGNNSMRTSMQHVSAYIVYVFEYGIFKHKVFR